MLDFIVTIAIVILALLLVNTVDSSSCIVIVLSRTVRF
jgi:hypothetical protein